MSGSGACRAALAAVEAQASQVKLRERGDIREAVEAFLRVAGLSKSEATVSIYQQFLGYLVDAWCRRSACGHRCTR